MTTKPSAELAIASELVAVLFFGATLLLRPTELGESLTSIGLVLAVLAAALSVAIGRTEQSGVQSGLVGLRTAYGLGFLLWMYLGFQGLVMQPGRQAAMAKSVVAHLVFLSAGAIVLGRRDVASRFVRIWAWLLALASASYLLSVVAGLVFHRPLQELRVFHLTVPTYPGSGDVLLPATPIYRAYVFHNSLPRLVGWLREPGIAQAFYVWAAVMFLRESRMTRTLRWIVALLLMAGALLTFSTVAIVSVGLMAGFSAAFEVGSVKNTAAFVRRLLRLTVLLPISVGVAALALFVPGVGLRYKLASEFASVHARMGAIQVSIVHLATNPFGTGLYGATAKNAGINLIAQASQIGVLGVVVLLCLYAWVIVWSRPTKQALMAVTPLLITATVSQPLVDAPTVYAVLFATVVLLGKRTIASPDASNGK